MTDCLDLPDKVALLGLPSYRVQSDKTIPLLQFAEGEENIQLQVTTSMQGCEKMPLAF